MRSLSKQVGVLALALLATGCVSQSRYDKLVTEYNSEMQARRQLEDEISRHQGHMSDLNTQLASKDEAYSQLATTAQADRARIAELEGALSAAQKSFPVENSGDGVEVFQTNEGFAYRIADSLLFASGSTDIREAGKKALLTIAREINEKGYKTVRIDGHTDSDPVVRTIDKYPRGNHELAAERALSVYSTLTKEGKVPEAACLLVSFGPNKPVDTAGKSDAAKSKNRRVEIHIAVPTQKKS
jgi:flagellar motor protein MotB